MPSGMMPWGIPWALTAFRSCQSYKVSNSLMNVRVRPYEALLASALLACSLAGCSSINEKLSNGMGDYVPQWAGGLPADAPPRPGTPQYDAYLKERERKRLMPAADREKEEQAQKGTTGSTSGDAVR